MSDLGVLARCSTGIGNGNGNDSGNGSGSGSSAALLLRSGGLVLQVRASGVLGLSCAVFATGYARISTLIRTPLPAQ